MSVCRSHIFLKRAVAAGLCWVAVTSCSTALEREGRCLASLTPEFLSAYHEIRRLEHEWRAEIQAREEGRFHRNRFAPHFDSGPIVNAWSGERYELPPTEREERAYTKLEEARARHRDTMTWYGRVYNRFRTRLEEDQLLSETRAVLFMNPAIIFYPIVRWNIRSVLWDGIDPDADTDPVTRFCQTRLATLSRVGADDSVAWTR